MTIFQGKFFTFIFLFSILGFFQGSAYANDLKMEKCGALHRGMLKSKKINITKVKYKIPSINLIDSYDNKVNLEDILNSNQPLALNFIFTTCTTICPVMTATFAQLRRKLKKRGVKMVFVSITIDPEFDRPQVLQNYAANFNPGADWTFLTGKSENISKVIKFFDANDGTKMNHHPLTLLKNSDQEWIRVDGLAKSKDLVKIVSQRLVN